MTDLEKISTNADASSCPWRSSTTGADRKAGSFETQKRFIRLMGTFLSFTYESMKVQI